MNNHKANNSFTFCDVKLFNNKPSLISAFGADTFNSLIVFPKPLLPEVANRVIVLLEKSCDSRNVLIIVGATYHHIGN